MKIDANTVFYIPPQSGIGDALQYSRHGEFFQREYGCKLKLNYIDKWGIFKNNPYVEKVDTKWDVNLWEYHSKSKMGSPVYRQLSKFFDLTDWKDDIKPSMYLDPVRHFHGPVLAISVEGAYSHREKGHTREIPESIAIMLYEQLKDKFLMVQVGGENDYRVDGTFDMRGWKLDKTHEFLTGCDLFIGVNSGMMHLAACVDIPMYIYTTVGVTDPPWENSKVFPTHEWFYRSTKYIGAKGMENVIPIMEFIEKIK